MLKPGMSLNQAKESAEGKLESTDLIAQVGAEHKPQPQALPITPAAVIQDAQGVEVPSFKQQIKGIRKEIMNAAHAEHADEKCEKCGDTGHLMEKCWMGRSLNDVKAMRKGEGSISAPMTDASLNMNEKLSKEHIGWNAMVSKLKREGHSQKSAEKIAGAIKAKKYGVKKDDANAGYNMELSEVKKEAFPLTDTAMEKGTLFESEKLREGAFDPKNDDPADKAGPRIKAAIHGDDHEALEEIPLPPRANKPAAEKAPKKMEKSEMCKSCGKDVHDGVCAGKSLRDMKKSLEKARVDEGQSADHKAWDRADRNDRNIQPGTERNAIGNKFLSGKSKRIRNDQVNAGMEGRHGEKVIGTPKEQAEAQAGVHIRGGTYAKEKNVVGGGKRSIAGMSEAGGTKSYRTGGKYHTGGSIGSRMAHDDVMSAQKKIKPSLPGGKMKKSEVKFEPGMSLNDLKKAQNAADKQHAEQVEKLVKSLPENAEKAREVLKKIKK